MTQSSQTQQRQLQPIESVHNNLIKLKHRQEISSCSGYEMRVNNKSTSISIIVYSNPRTVMGKNAPTDIMKYISLS